MSVLSGKKVLLGITGGIAAYKTPLLVRLFIKAGAEVKVILTQEAKDFVTPLTLSTLSKNPVVIDFVQKEGNLWNNHVELGKWADFLCIAPLTANTLSKLVSGHSDNFLLATYLSATCPVYLAPAMDLDMFRHQSTQDNFKRLTDLGHQIIEPEEGELASGLVGKGRMAEPEHIFQAIETHYKKQLKLYGKQVLITAGPTYEAIDPVRFIGNHSSGKMGYALAEVAAENGASVTLVSGPTALKISHPEIRVVPVVSAEEMFQAATRFFERADVVIAAAAVADYRPRKVAEQKIKKKGEDLVLELEETTDILKSLGARKSHQFMVGFALETEHGRENAQRKLERKNLDFIVLNSLQDRGAGFKTDTNKISIIKKADVLDFDLKSKREVAQDIIREIGNALELK